MLQTNNLISIDRNKLVNLLLSRQTPIFILQRETIDARNKPLIEFLDIALSRHAHILDSVLQEQGVI